MTQWRHRRPPDSGQHRRLQLHLPRTRHRRPYRPLLLQRIRKSHSTLDLATAADGRVNIFRPYLLRQQWTRHIALRADAPRFSLPAVPPQSVFRLIRTSALNQWRSATARVCRARGSNRSDAVRFATMAALARSAPALSFQRLLCMHHTLSSIITTSTPAATNFNIRISRHHIDTSKRMLIPRFCLPSRAHSKAAAARRRNCAPRLAAVATLLPHLYITICTELAVPRRLSQTHPVVGRRSCWVSLIAATESKLKNKIHTHI